ncbi:MAG TPA: class A beta-lactamase [Steroidobacteraceae bacterium]|jgi:beta-lactamase class A|nr:class A beta-lactamase [Steroidobacteraceae bacterium]
MAATTKNFLMMLNRRALFSAIPGLIAWSALSREAPRALVAYERDSGGRIGLYAENLTTGVRISWRANERFVMCSTFKASLAAMILARADHGQDQLNQMISYGPQDVPDWYAPMARKNLAKGAMSVADMCEAAVEYSDNTCANLLLARVGGPAALTAFWRSIGDAVTRLDHNEPILNRSPPGDPHDTTTPAAMAGNLRRLLVGRVLSPGSRERLTRWMVDCKTGDDRLRGGIPKTWTIADKTGNNGKDASGDIAVTWPKPEVPIVICAYTQGGSPSAARLTSVFADIGRMVGQQLG